MADNFDNRLNHFEANYIKWRKIEIYYKNNHSHTVHVFMLHLVTTTSHYKLLITIIFKKFAVPNRTQTSMFILYFGNPPANFLHDVCKMCKQIPSLVFIIYFNSTIFLFLHNFRFRLNATFSDQFGVFSTNILH